MGIADVIRAALKEYVTPTQPEAVAIPIAGKVKPVNGEYIILPTSLLNGDKPRAGQQSDCPQEGRYLEFETLPPTAPSITDKP